MATGEVQEIAWGVFKLQQENSLRTQFAWYSIRDGPSDDDEDDIGWAMTSSLRFLDAQVTGQGHRSWANVKPLFPNKWLPECLS